MNFFRGGLFLVFLTVAFGLASSFCLADSFEVDYAPVKDRITFNDTAEYYLIVSNLQNFNDDFRIVFSIDPKWSIQVLPPRDVSFSVAAGDSKSVRFTVMPVSEIMPGAYNLPVEVRSEATGLRVREHVPVHILPIRHLAHPHDIDAELYIEEKIDPREEIEIVIELKNNKNHDIEKLNLRLSSNLINREESVSLGPMEEKRVVITEKISLTQAPVSDLLSLNAYIGDFSVAFVADVPFEVISYSEVEKSCEIVKSFLKSEEVIVYKNLGNIYAEEQLNVNVGIFSEIFTSVPGSEVQKIDRERVRVIGFSLGPYEEKEFRVIRNFRPLFSVLVLIILVCFLYFNMRSDIVARKKASVIKTKEGGITELRIVLNIINRTPKKLKNVSIIDRVPNIADIDKDFPMGTLRPDKIVLGDKKSKIIKWNIDAIDRHEERVLSYNIKSKLSIIGGMGLPHCIVRYEDEKGRKGSSYSNIVTLSVK